MGYDTLEEAGVYAIARAYRCSRVYECSGLIWRRADGKYEVGPVDSAYSGDSASLDYDDHPAGTKVVADYHTHPCLPDSHYPDWFSPQDVHGNDKRKTVGFMGNLCTGEVHEYIPSKTPTTRLIEGEFSFNGPVAHGPVIGMIIVEHVSYEPNTGAI